MERVTIFGDIHGNLSALEAVLADISEGILVFSCQDVWDEVFVPYEPLTKM